jgi:hypothetical protein
MPERDTLFLPDLVLTGLRDGDGEPSYFVVEVSAEIGPNDVQQAADRAELLEKLGRPVMAVVAGRSITGEAVALARARSVWQVLEGAVKEPLLVQAP